MRASTHPTLLLAEEESQFPQAAEELAAAARLLPLNPRVFYNYGLVLQKLGRPGEAETQLKRAHTLVPGEFDFANALVHLYMQEGRWQDALPYAEQLSARAPGDPALSRLLQVIRQRAGAM